MKLTVACVFVKGHVPFSAEYVFRLNSMVSRNLKREYRFVCLTDQPEIFDPQTTEEYVEAIRIPKPEPGVYGWWSKLQLFNPDIEALQDGRCLYLDLDTIIVDKLDEIVDFDSEFALVPDGAPNFHGKGLRKAVKLFNSSVMVWNGGQFNYLYETFENEVTKRLWGDQDWIGEQLPNGTLLPSHWFPRISECRGDEIPEYAKVVLCKKPKNVDALRLYPWVKEAWQ